MLYRSTRGPLYRSTGQNINGPNIEAMAEDQPDTTSTVRTSTSYRSTALQEAMATDQPDTTSTVQTSTSYRSTALQINKNRLMYRALYQQICSSDQLLHTSTNIAKTLTQREKRLREKNANCPQIKIQQDLPQGENPQREERLRKTCFVFICGLTFSWGYFTQRGEKIRIIWKISKIKFIRICLKKYFHREKKD